MKLEKFKEKDNKRIGIIVFTVVCILLVSGVILYRTFAIFEVKTNQNVIKGTVQDPGDIYFAFYKDNQIQKEMPKKEDGYVLDEEASYCGVTGENDSEIKVFVSEDNMIHVSGVTTSRTKCNLYFIRGAYLLGKGVPIVESGEGLYEVKHDEVSEINEGFKETEYRYAGANPNNYIKFNNESWRIIGLVNVLVPQADGSEKVEQRIKIVKNDSIGSYSWDTSNSLGENKWNEADLMTLLNDYYYNSKASQNCWGQKDNLTTFEQLSCSFDGIDDHITGLKSVWNMIDENIVWTLGEKFEINIITENAYQKERIINGDDSKWPNETSKSSFHSIGLMYPSDFGYAYENRECTKNNLLNNSSTNCYETNWFYVNDKSTNCLLTASIKNRAKVQNLLYNKYLYDNYDAYGASNVHPVIYLKTNIKIYDGNGTEENPFQLKQEIYG